MRRKTQQKITRLSQEELDRGLISAAIAGDLPAVKSMLEAGASIHAKDGSALNQAAFLGQSAIVDYLLALGADPKSDDSAALRWACHAGHLAIAKTLLEKGADLHAKNDWAVFFAAFNNRPDVVRFLLAQGADCHTKGDQLLFFAVRNGHRDVFSAVCDAIFAPGLWMQKSDADRKAEAERLTAGLKAFCPHLEKDMLAQACEDIERQAALATPPAPPLQQQAASPTQT